MSLTFQFLGCGDTFGSGGRLQTCFSLRGEGWHMLVDCGATALVALKRHQLDPNSVDAVLVSHLHGDHFGGLPFLILDAQLVSRRTRPLLVAGPPGIARRVHDAMEVLFPGSAGARRAFAVEFVELPERRPTGVGPVTATAFAVEHPSGAPAYALRLAAAGRTIAYSGDTAWTGALAEAAAGADLFVAEAYYFEKRVPYHLDFATLRSHLPSLGCRRVILTHMSTDMLARQAEAGVEAAADGLVVEL